MNTVYMNEFKQIQSALYDENQKLSENERIDREDEIVEHCRDLLALQIILWKEGLLSLEETMMALQGEANSFTKELLALICKATDPDLVMEIALYKYYSSLNIVSRIQAYKNIISIRAILAIQAGENPYTIRAILRNMVEPKLAAIVSNLNEKESAIFKRGDRRC